MASIQDLWKKFKPLAANAAQSVYNATPSGQANQVIRTMPGVNAAINSFGRSAVNTVLMPQVAGEKPTTGETQPQYKERVVSNFNKGGSNSVGSNVGNIAGNFVALNPIVNAARLGSNLGNIGNPVQLVQNPGKTGGAVADYAVNRFTGIPKIVAIDKFAGTSALKKLGAYGTLRGLESVGSNQAQSLMDTGNVDKRVGSNVGAFGAGFALNSLLSPKLSIRAGKELNQIGTNIKTREGLKAGNTLFDKVYDPITRKNKTGQFITPEERSVHVQHVSEEGYEKMLRSGKPFNRFKIISGDRGMSNKKVSVVTDSNTGEFLSASADRPQFQSYIEDSANGKTALNFADYQAQLDRQKGKPADLTREYSMKGAQARDTPTNMMELGTPAPTAKERKYVTSAKNSPVLDPKTKQLVNGDYNVRSNKELQDTVSKQLKKEGIESAISRIKTDTTASDETVVLSQQVSQKLQKQGRHEEAANLINETAAKLTEAGRTVQAAALLNRMTPEGLSRVAATQLQKDGKKLTGEQQKKITELMKRADGFADGSREQNLARQKAFEYVRDLTPSPLIDQISAIWKAGLLTGAKTSGFNIVANTSNAAIKKLSDLPATAADAFIGTITGKRTKTLTNSGIVSGAKRGFSEGWDYLVSGYDPSKVGTKAEQSGTVFANNLLGKVAKGYTETVFRFIGSQDRPFYFSSLQNSLEDQARAALKNAKKGGKVVDPGFIKNFMANPPVDAVKRAASEAETSVFQQKTAIGELASNVSKNPIGRFLVPFTRTPSAVVTEVANYTPVGAIAEAVGQIRKGKLDQRALSQAIGKATTGTAFLYLGGEMAKAGLVNTSFPTDEQSRELWKAENRQENSIIVNGIQVPAASLGPIGNVLIAGAAMQNAKDTGGDPKSVLVAQIGNTALESPALQGLSGTIDALKDPNRSAQSLINSQAGSVVPTLVSDIAQLSDRAQNGQGVARETNNTLDAITNRIPGIRQTNPISVDTLGRERSTGKNAFQTTLDPLRTKSLNQTPVTNEISRLVSLGGKTGFTKQDKKISAFGQDINLTPEELNSLTKSSGSQINQRITSLINSPLYSSLDDASKSKAISNAISEIRSNAKKNAVVSGANLVNDLLAATDKTRSGDVTVTRPLTSSVKSTKPSTDELNMAKYIVSQGDQDQMKVGNTYVYRNENGDVLTKTEDQIQREVTNANITIGLEQAKRNKDYTTWEKLQAQQFNDLQKLNQTLDPVLDAAKIIQNQNKQQDIITQVQKYRSYGGSFKKPAKVRKPKSSPVSLKATRLKITQPKIKKVSVKKLSLKVKKYKVRKPKTYKA